MSGQEDSLTFQQQGSIDWVALSNSSFTFALDVLVRLSKADLNPATLAVAAVTSNHLVIKPDTQKKIHEALSRLRSFSTYGKVAWFGFGIRTILKDLADTENGIACLALCACLSTSYDSFFAATVLRELCKLRGAPSNLIPSIHQWKILVQICSGSLSATKFSTLLGGLFRIISPNPDLSFHRPTNAGKLAEAIAALAGVSNQKLSRLTIAGGLDCIWLAAFAEWLLSLDVEISLQSGTMYRSSTARHQPDVSILFISENEPSLQLTRCFIVPKGQTLWHYPKENQPIIRVGYCEWKEILSAAFGSRIDILLRGVLQPTMAEFLNYASHWTENYYRRGPVGGRHGERLSCSKPFNRFNFASASSRGEGFLEFAKQCLPELGAVLDLCDRSKVRYYQNVTIDNCLRTLTLACKCQSCWDENETDRDNATQFCLILIAETIVLLVWLLSAIKVDDALTPSPQGLRQLYMKHQNRKDWHHHPSPDWSPEWSRVRQWHFDATPCFPSGHFDILTASLVLFSGSTDAESSYDESSSALCHNGICVFFSALEDLDQTPERATSVRVMPGHIDFEGIKYERVCDFDDVITHTNGIVQDISYNFIVQEAPQPGFLSAAYEVTCGDRSRCYMLNIAWLATVIADSVRGSIQCRGLCKEKGYLTPFKVILSSDDVNDRQAKAKIPMPSWSLMSAYKWPFKSAWKSAIDLQLVQGTNKMLYTELAQGKAAYHLRYLKLCDNCRHCFREGPLGNKAEDTTIPLEQPHGSVAVKCVPQSRPLVQKRFKISVVSETSQCLPGPQNLVKRSRREALKTAAMAEQEGILQLLVQGGARLINKDPTERTALHLAACAGHIEIVTALLLSGSICNTKDEDGHTPLSVAVQNGHLSIVLLLLQQGAHADTLKRRCQNPLVEAARFGNMEILEILLQAGSIVNKPSADRNGRIALVAAAEEGHLAVIERLLQANADVNVQEKLDGKTALQAAVEGGHLAIVERLLYEKADVNATGGESEKTALQVAAKRGDIQILETLLQADANVDNRAMFGQTALEEAAKEGHLTVVERLLQGKAEVNALTHMWGRTPLQAASGNGNLVVVERLLQEDADVHAVVEIPDEALLQSLRSNFARGLLEASFNDDRTPLQAAALGGHLAVVEKLLQHGANVNAVVEPTKRTALLLAARGGHLKVVVKLLQAKADSNASDLKGWTALHEAVQEGHKAIVEMLLLGNANINTATLQGSTALQIAAQKCDLSLLELLLQKKADVDATDVNGMTALQIAEANSHTAVVERLIEWQASNS